VPEKRSELPFDLERIKAIAWRRLPWLVIPVVALMPVVLAAVAVLPPDYQANGTLLVQEPEIINPLASQQHRRISANQRRINMEQKMLSSENLLGVVAELGLDREVLYDTPLESLLERVKEWIPPLRPKPIDEARLREQLIARLRRRVLLRLRGDQLIQVSYRGINASLNARIVNRLLDGFIEEALGSQRRVSQASVKFFERTLLTYKRNLEESERLLREFREKHFDVMPVEIDGSVATLSQDKQNLVDREINLRHLQAQLEAIDGQIASEQESITTEETTETDPRVAELQQQITQMEIERTRLGATLTDINPKIIALKETIAELKEELEQEQLRVVTRQVTSVNPVLQQLRTRKSDVLTEIEAERTRIALLKERVSAAETRVRSVPAEQQELARLQRNRDLDRALYNQMYNQLEAARVGEDLVQEQEHIETYKIVERAQASTIPAGPDRKRLIVVGMAMCCAIGIAATAALEFIDQSFSDSASAREFLNLPLLATIPPIMTAHEIRRRRMKRTVLLSLLAVVLAIEAITGLVVSGML